MSQHQRNVGTLERISRIIGGAVAAVAGIYTLASGSSLWAGGLGVAGIALGLDFIYTGVTGYCPLYGRLGWSTARTRVATESASAGGGGHGTTLSRGPSARVVLPVLDLACAGGDASAVERVIAKVPGVLHAYVNPATDNAYVDYDPDRVTSAAIAAKVRELGYGTTVRGL